MSFPDFTEEVRERAFENFVRKSGYSREDAGSVWDRMNGGRIWYYWEAEEELETQK